MSLLKKLLLVGINLMVVFVTLEVCARFDDTIKWGAPFFSKYNDHQLREVDKDGLRRNIPDRRYEKWAINSSGFRGPTIDTVKSPGKLRVVCMGTSETYGGCESEDMEWPYQVQTMLGEDSNIEIMNPSIPGLRLKEYIEYLTKYVMVYDPDVMVLVFFPAPYFTNLQRWPNYSPETREKPKATTAGAGFSLSTVTDNLRVIPKAKQVAKGFLPKPWVTWYQVRQAVKTSARLEAHYLKGDPPRNSIPPEWVDSLTVMVDSLVNWCQAQDLELVLTTYPTFMNDGNLDEYPEIFHENRRFFVELSLKGMVDGSRKAKQVLEEASSRHGLPLLYLDEAIPNEPLYYCDNVHYNDSGAAIVASIVAEFLESEYGRRAER